MRVELLKHWRGHKPGKVFTEMPDGAGGVLVRRGFARECDESYRPEQPAKPARKKPCPATPT